MDIWIAWVRSITPDTSRFLNIELDIVEHGKMTLEIPPSEVKALKVNDKVVLFVRSDMRVTDIFMSIFRPGSYSYRLSPKSE